MKLGESGEAFFVEELPEEEHEVGPPGVMHHRGHTEILPVQEYYVS